MMRDNEKDYYHTDIDYLDLSDAVSAHECTGLIPDGESQAADDEKYKRLYAFGTPLKCADAVNCHRRGHDGRDTDGGHTAGRQPAK